uniref:Uncharacterized protein MANES_14G127400 n=1 Tax=Rhizophora mucronata TaxID=61149 RepID=A0A2P2J6V6_RHIMU
MASLPLTPTPNPHFSSSKPTKFRKASLPKPKFRQNLHDFYFHSI